LAQAATTAALHNPNPTAAWHRIEPILTPRMKFSKFLIIMASLSPFGGLQAQQFVVFAKGDFCQADAAGRQPPTDPARAAFLDAARKDFAGRAAYDATLDLINPPSWGRVVSPQTTGSVQIRRAFGHGFRFGLSLDHLLPNHDYILTINSRPRQPGNDLLPESVPGHEAEKYYDFFIATTDAQGSCRADFALFLIPGAYNVRFYVKDTSDFKIVLYHDYFDFTAS
jgi:hypothetical protein